jgi:WD40 repeat protein
MAVMKVRCPECDAPIKLTIDPVDEPTEMTVNCPKCEAEFVSLAEPPAGQATKQGPKSSPKAAQKPGKPRRRDDDDDDDDDDDPRQKRRKGQQSGSNMMLIAGVGGGLLVVGGIVAAVLALGGDKKDDTAKKDDNSGQPAPAAAPGPGAMPGAGTPGRPGTSGMRPPGGGSSAAGPWATDPTPNPGRPGTNQNPSPFPGPEASGGTADSGTGTSGTGTPDTGTTAADGQTTGSRPPTKPGELPPPPVVKLEGTTEAPAAKLDSGTGGADKPPPIPPLAPDEDPFERAKTFRIDGAQPKLPKLPPPSQRPILTLDSGGHTAFVLNVFITPDSKRVVTVGEDKAVRVWDLQTGTPERTLRLPAGQGDEGSLRAAAISSDGKTLAVGGIPVKGAAPAGKVPVFVLDIERSALVRSIIVTGDEVSCLDFSGDGRRIAVGCADGNLHLFDVKSGARVGGGSAHRAPVREVRYQPNGAMLGTIGLDGVVRAWDSSTNTMKSLGSLAVGDIRPTTLAWSNDGQLLAVGGMTGEIRMYNSQNAQLVRTLKAKKGANGRDIDVRRMKFLPGDQEILHCGAGGPKIGWAGIVNAQTGAIRCAFFEHTNVVFALNLSDDGAYVVSSGGNQNETYVWSPTTQKPVSRLCGPGKGVWGVGWARDGKSIAWGTINKPGADGNPPLESVFKLNEFMISTQFTATTYQQEISTDSSGFRTEHDRGRTILMGSATGRPGVADVGDKIFAATLLPGRGLVAVACARSLQVYDARTARKVRECVGHTGNVLSVAPSPDGRYFVTGSSDQTIRVWMPEFDEPVLSVFVADRDWIAWTAGGMYACSPQGERLIAWQVNSVTPGRFPVVHPAERFHNSLHQPALIKYLVPTGSLVTAMAMARKFDGATLKTHSIADAIPPEVTLTDLAEDGVVIDKDKFVVKATAAAKIPINSMRLLVDGRPFQGAAGVKRFAKPGENAEASWEVPLLPGPHTFAVIADTGLSKGMSRVARVVRSGTPPKPNLYVLAVGISAYPGDMKLHYAASDALLLKEAFETYSKDVFGKVEVRLLTDATATRKNIVDGLDWLKTNVEAKDVGVVSFSGHGMRDDDGRFYLVTVDIDKRNPEGTCLSGDEFKNRLESLPGRIVAILDACHSGAVAEKDKAHAPRTDNLVRDLVSEDSGVIVMCASLGREVSWENSQTKAGFFTFALVEGMREFGDIDQDGLVYINELDRYAAARVAQLSKGGQTPTLGRPPTIRPFPIAATGKKPVKKPDEKKPDDKPPAEKK